MGLGVENSVNAYNQNYRYQQNKMTGQANHLDFNKILSAKEGDNTEKVQKPNENSVSKVDTYTEYLKAKYGNIMIQNVGSDQKSMDSLGTGTYGMNNIVIAPNVLETMANDPKKAAYYEKMIQDFFASQSTVKAQMAITGEPDGRPMKVGVALVDVLAGLYCANGIQAALLHRERTGEALHIEVPLMEAALAGLVNVAAGSLMTGEPPRRWGNAHPQIVPYQSFRCQDGDVAIGVGSDRQFEVLAMWLGLDLEARPEWKKNRGRVKDREELVALIEARTGESTVEDVLSMCEANAIPASRVRSVDEVLYRQGGTLHNLLQPLFEMETNTMVPTLATPLLLNGERFCASLSLSRWKP